MTDEPPGASENPSLPSVPPGWYPDAWFGIVMGGIFTVVLGVVIVMQATK